MKSFNCKRPRIKFNAFNLTLFSIKLSSFREILFSKTKEEEVFNNLSCLQNFLKNLNNFSMIFFFNNIAKLIMSCRGSRFYFSRCSLSTMGVINARS